MRPVEVRLRITGGAEPETLRATLVEGEAFRLAASALGAPLAEGDLVRCTPDDDGVLRIVDVLEPADAVLTVFAPGPVWDDDRVDALVQLWTATGAGSTLREGPFLVTVWPQMTMDDVATQLNSDEDAGKGEWILAAEPEERTREALEDVDFGGH